MTSTSRNWIGCLATVFALATASLSGCTYPGSAQDSSSTSPAETTEAQNPPPAGNDGAETPAGDAPVDDSAVDELHLTPEAGVLYLRAIQAFTPLLESWAVDQEDGSVRYLRYTCAGLLDDGGTGALEPYDADRWQVTWDGGSPLLMTSGATERILLTERTLVLGSVSSTASTDIELAKFIEICKKADETVAGFVLD